MSCTNSRSIGKLFEPVTVDLPCRRPSNQIIYYNKSLTLRVPLAVVV